MYWYDFLRIGLVPKYFILNYPLEASESQTKVFTVLKKPIWVQRIMLYTFIDHSISVGWSDYDNLYWAGVKSMFKVFISMFLALKMLTLYWMNDQDIISPYNINAMSSRKVMKVKKNIQKTKFSKLTSQEWYGKK